VLGGASGDHPGERELSLGEGHASLFNPERILGRLEGRSKSLSKRQDVFIRPFHEGAVLSGIADFCEGENS
jgi:hypothetical protein